MKPWYCKTSGYTDQQIQDAFDLCVDNGAYSFEGIIGHRSADHVFLYDPSCFNYFGVTECESLTYFDGGIEVFGGSAVEITLDQLPAHLGIESPEEKKAFEAIANNSEIPNGSEWNNGDECVYMNHKVIQQFVGHCPKREGYCYIQAPSFEINFVEMSKLSKPETPEQR